MVCENASEYLGRGVENQSLNGREMQVGKDVFNGFTTHCAPSRLLSSSRPLMRQRKTILTLSLWNHLVPCPPVMWERLLPWAETAVPSVIVLPNVTVIR